MMAQHTLPDSLRSFRLLIRPVLLVFGLCVTVMAHAANSLEEWRNTVTVTRTLAENAAPRAHNDALRLQATLPVDATPDDKARVLNLLARIEVYTAQTEAAANHAQQALKLAKQNVDRVGQAEAYLTISLNSVNQGRIDVLVDAAPRALEVLQGVNRPDLLGEAMLRLAMMYLRTGRFDESVSLCMQALDIARRSNAPLALLYAHQGMGISYEQSNHHAEALDHFKKMRDLARAVHVKQLEADAIDGMSTSVANLGDWRAADVLNREAITLYRVAGTPFNTGHGLFLLANNLRMHGRLADSLPLFGEVIAIYERYPNKIGLWWTLNARSENLQSLGRLATARADAERAYVLAQDIGLLLYRSESARRMAALTAAAGDHKRAYEFSVEAADLAGKMAREKSSARMDELAQRYQSESKQRQIDELTRRNEQQDARQRWLWTILGGGIALLAVTAYFLLRLRHSNRMLKALNTQVQRSHNKLQATLDAVPDLLFELGLDGRYYDYHSSRTDLLYVPTEALLGKTVSDILSFEAADICMSALREAHEKGTSTGKQFELPLPHGKSWFELSVVRKSRGQEEEPRFIVLSRDITERKETERLLHEREQAIRAVVEHSPDMIARYDTQCRRIYVNPAMQALFGLLLEEILGKTPVELSPLPEAQAYMQMIREVLESGQEVQMKFPFSSIQGEVRWGHMRVVPEFGTDGAVASVLAVTRDISSLKETERYLEEAQTRLLSVLQTIPDLVWLKNTEGVYLTCNHAFERFFGAGEADIIGRTDYDFVDAELADFFRRKDQEALDAGRICINEEWVTFAEDNRRALLETRKVPVYGADGKVVGVLGISRDITERKRTEEALAVREREFRTLTENIPDNIVRYDLQARKTYVNPALVCTLGLDHAVLIGKTPQESSLECVVALGKYEKKLKQVLESGEPDEFEMAVLHAMEGAQIHNVRFVAERDAQGRIVGVLSVGRDVTAQKAAEEALREREQRYREIFDNTTDGLYLLDVIEGERFRNLDINPAFEKSTGMRRDELIGKFVDETVPSETAQPVIKKYRRCIEAGTAIEEEVELDLPAGRRYYHSTLVPIYDGGRIYRIVGISRDITELKQAERDLEESRIQLRGLTARREEAREEERKYIAREVHDELGQILTGLQLNVSVLEHKFAAGSPPLREHLKETMMLTDKALGVARNVASALRPAALDMGIVSALEWLAGRFGSNTGIRCEVHIEDKDIQLDENLAIALFRIVQESLTNVVRHARADRIDIVLGRVGDDCSLKVRDNGSGFDLRAAKKMDSFGLVGMRERALLLGGEVIINSRPGEGTEVEVHIPAHNISRAL